MTRGYRSWFQELINVWTMPATMLKNSYVQVSHSQCRFCKLKMLYMFKTFVSLLSGHVSYKDCDTAVFSVHVLQMTDQIFSKHFSGRRVGRKLPWSVRVKRYNMLAFSRLMIYRTTYSAHFSYILKL